MGASPDSAAPELPKGNHVVSHLPAKVLSGLPEQDMFGKLPELGKESANYFRDVLPYALQCYGHIWVATHVPPFTWAAFYKRKPCERTHQPHYVNVSAGCAIRGISKSFPKSRLSVLCGHTHSAADVNASDRVRVIGGEARTKFPQMQKVFEVSGPQPPSAGAGAIGKME